MKTLDQFNIAGRSALVTGAASGIGLAYAEAMAEAGAKVTLADLDGAGAEREAARLRSEGAEARAAQADVSDLAQSRRRLTGMLRHMAGLTSPLPMRVGMRATASGPPLVSATRQDGSINMIPPIGRAPSISTCPAPIIRSARRCAACGRAGARAPSSQPPRTPGIINEAIVGIPYMPAKAGVLHLVRHAALELAEFGIRVNAIAPGPFITNIGDGWVKKNPDAKLAFDKTIPLGAMAETHQIKPLALLLASDASSYMTGAHVVIDGGVVLGNFK